MAIEINKKNAIEAFKIIGEYCKIQCDCGSCGIVKICDKLNYQKPYDIADELDLI